MTTINTIMNIGVANKVNMMSGNMAITEVVDIMKSLNADYLVNTKTGELLDFKEIQAAAWVMDSFASEYSGMEWEVEND